MPTSTHSSTTCSSPTNDTVEKVFKNDTVRYVRKGYGIIMAGIMTFAFFFILPSLIRNSLWDYVLSIGNKKWMYAIVVYGVHEATFISSNLMMWMIYTQKIPFFEKYRINPDRKWPWEENPAQWKFVLRKSLKSLMISHLVIIPLAIFLDVQTGVVMRTGLEDFPSCWEIILQITVFMFVEDFCFYWLHRTLHQKPLYTWIHKIHHEYNNPIGISAEYAHPIEFVLANLIPTSMGSKILGSKVHLATYALWGALRIFETIDGHCGYEFSWSPYRLLPLSGSANYHNYHHTHNVGNYGSFFMIWDLLMGTNKSYFSYLSKKEKSLALSQMRGEYEKKSQEKDQQEEMDAKKVD